MFMKPSGELNFATRLSTPAGTLADTAEVLRGGAAYIDAPNLMCTLYSRLGPPLIAPRKLDLRRLRRGLEKHGIANFEFVIAQRQGVNRRPLLRSAVERHAWKYVERAAPTFGWDLKDPVDDYIREMILRRARLAAPGGTLAVASHDGGYAPALEYALDEGWRLVIVGLLDQMSHQLKRLAGSQAEVIDLSEFGLVLPEKVMKTPRPAAPAKGDLVISA